MYQSGYNIDNWLDKEISQDDQRKFISNFVNKNKQLFTQAEAKLASKIYE